jgi:hypothetical protein
MTEKEIAKQAIDALPTGATMDDIIHALSLQAKIARSEQAIREGKVISHKEAKR